MLKVGGGGNASSNLDKSVPVEDGSMFRCRRPG